MAGASRFRERVYGVVGRIPRGKVASYGLVAMLAGRVGAARAVGAAMRESGEEFYDKGGKGKLPCHRVVRADGGLAPKACFAGRQRGMLEREGVKFLPGIGGGGRVDMGRCEWDGA